MVDDTTGHRTTATTRIQRQLLFVRLPASIVRVAVRKYLAKTGGYGHYCCSQCEFYSVPNLGSAVKRPQISYGLYLFVLHNPVNDNGLVWSWSRPQADFFKDFEDRFAPEK